MFTYFDCYKHFGGYGRDCLQRFLNYTPFLVGNIEVAGI